MALHVDTVEAQFDIPESEPPSPSGPRPAETDEEEAERLRPVVLAILERELEALLRR